MIQKLGGRNCCTWIWELRKILIQFCKPCHKLPDGPIFGFPHNLIHVMELMLVFIYRKHMLLQGLKTLLEIFHCLISIGGSWTSKALKASPWRILLTIAYWLGPVVMFIPTSTLRMFLRQIKSSSVVPLQKYCMVRSYSGESESAGLERNLKVIGGLRDFLEIRPFQRNGRDNHQLVGTLDRSNRLGSWDKHCQNHSAHTHKCEK